jgi:hypothetical protein
MNWLRRDRQAEPAPPPERPPPAPEATEGAAPGITTVLDGLVEDRSHAVLDLGAATDASLRVYGRYARWVRFVDLAGDERWPRPAGSARTLLQAVPLSPRPYDLIFAWDVLDRVFPEERPHVMSWIAERAAPDARLHAIVRSSDEAPRHPLRFSLLDTDRIRYEVAGSGAVAAHRLLPAEVMNLLTPFHVVRAFTLKNGLREYAAVRGSAPG